ncbi:SDR family oxidoreductase, partial [Mesorhizobium sp. M8A.F.Ca.ET.059.01.1.1]
VFRESDLTREADVQAAVAAATERFGGLDAVVNCAGIYPTGKRLEELSDEDWDRTISVNLTAIFRVCRATLPLLRAAGGGSIVNIASVHADATVPGVPAYAATKAAVVGLSRQMALDYAVDRIRVNAVLVGSVATRMTLDGLEAAGGAEALGLSFEANRIARIANPSEIATAIGFLISDAASFVTGSAMQVDGGLLARLL